MGPMSDGRVTGVVVSVKLKIWGVNFLPKTYLYLDQLIGGAI
jgi:hypothetical protein